MLVPEYLYNLDLSQKSFTMKSKYFTTNVCKCMHDIHDMKKCMHDMHNPNGSSMEYSFAYSSEC